MKSQIIFLLLAINYGICSAQNRSMSESLVGAEDSISKLTEELQLLNSWFDGEFNNYGQVHKEKEDSVPTEYIHENIHSVFKKVSLPWLGDHVYFVKQYMDNEPKKIYRQRIYHFTINKAERAIQLDILSFSDPETEKKYLMSDKNPELLQTLTINQLKSIPGCEVFWKKENNRFIGYMKEKTCNFISRSSGKRIFITDSLMLNSEEIWIRDEAEDEDGNYVFGHKLKIPHKLKKVSHYTGWAAAIKEGENDMTAIRGLRFHNQGDKQKILFDDGSDTGFEVRLAQLIYGKDLEILQLAVFRTGEEKVLQYVWADPDSQRIGINIKGIFQVGLTKEQW